MSPANIYRYFSSKDALIAGMTERDRVRILHDFATIHDAPDMMDALGRLARKHLIEDPCGEATMALEIWAEAARNPAVGSMIRGIELAVHEGLCDVLVKVKRQGGIAPGIDIDAVARFVGTLVDGMFKRRALEKDFDGEWAVATVVSAVEAALSGRISLTPYSPSSGVSAHRAAASIS